MCCAAGFALLACGDSGGGPDAPVIPDASPNRQLLFTSDFGTALGTTAGAIGDSGRWSTLGADFEQSMEVVPASGLDIPSVNTLMVKAVANRLGFARVVTMLPEPAVGEHRFYRFYFRAMWPDGLEDPQTHPIEDDNARGWAFTCNHDVGGANQWQAYYGFDAANGFANYRWHVPLLEQGVTYRFEHQLTRVADTMFNFHVRVYDAAGALLYDDDDLTNSDGTTLSSNPVLILPEPDSLGRLQAGNNGIAGTNPPFPFTYAHQAAFCVAAADWCGAYDISERAF